MVWIVLGAIINPNSILPYATAILVLLIFFMAKYTEFSGVLESTGKKIEEEFDK